MHCCEDIQGLVPNGEELIQLGSVCHPGAPLTAVYHVSSESLTLACATCGQGVIDVAIAGRRSYAQRRRRLQVVESPKVVQRMDARAKKNRERKS